MLQLLYDQNLRNKITSLSAKELRQILLTAKRYRHGLGGNGAKWNSLSNTELQ